MTLTPFEFNQMQYLLGKSKYSPLSLTEQNELRSYIVKERPEAQNKPIEDLIALGLIIAGLYILYKLFEDSIH
jgi:hypothetical protein